MMSNKMINNQQQNRGTSDLDTLLCRVTKLWTRAKKQVLDNQSITYSQFEILSAIYYFTASQKEIIQVDLSEKTGIDPMTTSTILRNLEKKELITRMRGVENTRAIFVQLTSLGLEVYKQASFNIMSLSEILYNKIDEDNLSVQLKLLSEELYKLNN